MKLSYNSRPCVLARFEKHQQGALAWDLQNCTVSTSASVRSWTQRTPDLSGTAERSTALPSGSPASSTRLPPPNITVGPLGAPSSSPLPPPPKGPEQPFFL